MTAPPDKPAPGRLPFLLAFLVGALVVLTRSAAFVFLEGVHFDSDEAVHGLMALHISQLRDFPVFMYGQKYMASPLPYLAAPLFALLGPSVAALKSVELLLNLSTLYLLLRALCRDAGLPPHRALLAAAWFIAPSLVCTSYLTAASGGNMEGFFWILLVWTVRARGWTFGLVVTLGALNRDFTWFAVVCIVVVEGLFERVVDRAWLIRRGKAVAVYVVLNTLLVELGRLHPDYHGLFPHAARPTLEMFRQNSGFLLTALLPDLFGATGLSLAEWGIQPGGPAGVPGLAPVVYAVALLLSAWLLAWTVRRVARGLRALCPEGFPLFLIGIGLASVLAFVTVMPWGGGPNHGMLRYVLLVLFIPIGITAIMLREARWSRGAALLLCGVVLVASSASHASFLAGALRDPPVSRQRAVADALQQRGIRYAWSDYWTAYSVTFLAGERVWVASDVSIRLRAYQRAYREHLAEAVDIQPAECPPGTLVFRVRDLNVCRATDPERAPLK